MSCLGCGGERELGVLCGRCADELLRPSRFCPEQIQVRHAGALAGSRDAWLVDGFGVPRRVQVAAGREALVVGRSPEADVAILDPSVSQVHAELVYSTRSGGWYVLDRDSKNKTLVNGEATRRSWLEDGDRICFGAQVGFLFFAGGHEVIETFVRDTERDESSPVSTLGDASLDSDHARGGALRLESADGGGVARVGETVISLSLLQFELLSVLAEQLRQDEAAGRRDVSGFVASKALLASGLSFDTPHVSTNNLKGLIRSTRNKFMHAGIAHVIEARQNLGYRLILEV